MGNKEKKRRWWKELDGKQKARYFLDYGLEKLLLCAAAAGAAVFLLVSFLTPEKPAALYVAVVDESLDETECERMKAELEALYGEDRKVVIDDSFYMRDGALGKLEVYLYNKQIDAVIAEPEVYEQLAGYGYFYDLELLLSQEQKQRYGSLLVKAPGWREEEEISFEDTESGKGEEAPYGADISGSGRFGSMKHYMRSPVFSVAANAPQPEHAVLFLEYLLQNGEERAQ